MNFKCNLSGCVYTFESPLDIEVMKKSLDYTMVPDEPTVEVPAPQAPVGPATVDQVAPVPVAPAKPLPKAPVATVAV